MHIKQFSLVKLIITLGILPLLLVGVKKIVDLRNQAAGVPADLHVDLSVLGSTVDGTLWKNLSQGGEEPTNMLEGLAQELHPLQPKLIRLDHIFDFYEVYRPGQAPNFTKLDRVVDEILFAGARPFFSLSYTPTGMGESLVSAPTDWTEWSRLVEALILHYSGRNTKNITGVYYEVWNEPDLFGNWHYSKNPNYLTLYYHSASAAQRAKALCQPFKIGGPATTNFYTNWAKALIAFSAKNSLPLDFISWHQYSYTAEDYLVNSDKLTTILASYPNYFTLEKIVTEFGPDPEPSSWYDNHLSGIHLMALSTRLLGRLHKIFSFEVKDGPVPRNSSCSGWGILDYQHKPKPRWQALFLLAQISGQRLHLTGEGTYTTAIATKNKDRTQVLVVNYDPKNKHTESTPLTLHNISPGTYLVSITQYPSGKQSQLTATVSQSQYRHVVYLPPNSAYLLEFNPQ